MLLYFRKQESHTWDAHEILQELPRNLRVNVLEHEYLELLTQVRFSFHHTQTREMRCVTRQVQGGGVESPPVRPAAPCRLSQVSLLSGGSREMYRALCARIMPHHHHDGSVVFNAGEPALDVLIVVSGEARPSPGSRPCPGHVRARPRARLRLRRGASPAPPPPQVHVTEREFNTVHCVLGPGALFGEGSLFGENSRAYSVRSTQQSTLLSIRGTDLDNLLQGFPEITEQIRVRPGHKRSARRGAVVAAPGCLSLPTDGRPPPPPFLPAVRVRVEGGCSQAAPRRPQGACEPEPRSNLRSDSAWDLLFSGAPLTRARLAASRTRPR